METCPPTRRILDFALLPWNWFGASTARPFQWADDRPLLGRIRVAGAFQGCVVHPAGEVRSPALAVPPIDLKTWVRTPVSSSYAVRVPKGPDEKGKEPLVRQLDALATSWGAIADSLKLVRYFRVELPPGVTDAQVELLTAFPDFAVDVAENGIEDNPIDGPRTAWVYRRGGIPIAELRASLLKVTASVGPLSFDNEPLADAPGRKLDFASYWFAPAPVAVPPPADPAGTSASELAYPHALAVRVLDSEHAKEIDVLDPWCKVSGVGVLVQRDAQPWLCMNGAVLVASSTQRRVFDDPTAASLPLLLRGVKAGDSRETRSSSTTSSRSSRRPPSPFRAP